MILNATSVHSVCILLSRFKHNFFNEYFILNKQMSSRGVLLEERARGNCPRCPPSLILPCLEYIKGLKRNSVGTCTWPSIGAGSILIRRANIGLKLAQVEKCWLHPSSWPAHLVWLWDIFRGVVGWESVRLRTASPHPFCTTLKHG